MSFETTVDRTPVKGTVYIEKNEPIGLYVLNYFQLSLGKADMKKRLVVPVPSNKFVCSPWEWIRLDEAVNLMQGRFVYRKPDLDPVGEGYWLYLSKDELFQGVRQLGFIRTRFDVGNYLSETGLNAWVGLNGWLQLVEVLERGARCDLAIGAGAAMNVIRLEADPREQRLKLFDLQGRDLPLTRVMKRKYNGNVE